MLKHWPPLNALRGFEAAARLGSFHKAAEALNLTQSAISQQIRSLETYLEQPLFHRSGRSVSLTDAGHDLLSTTQSLLQHLAVGIRRLDQYRKPNQLVGQHHAGVCPALAAAAVGRFSSALPGGRPVAVHQFRGAGHGHRNHRPGHPR